MATDTLPGDDNVADMREGSRYGRLVLPGLPVPATSFVGRDAELASLHGALAEPATRLLTLTGPGGIGKTRLALEVARRHQANANVAFVPLDTTSRPDMIADTIVQRLEIELARDETPVDAVRRVIGDRPLLLVLDNLEHLLPGVHVLIDLLEACSGLTILATSRVRLGLRDERVVSLKPLHVPVSGDESGSDASRAEAVRLFSERAQAAQPAFTLGAHNLKAVVTIVQRLDGLPLAIELAAARASLLSPLSLAERLEQRLPLLTGGSPDTPSRQQTMKAAIAWSVDLLPDDVRLLWERLGVCSGGFTIEAAEAIAETCGSPGLPVMDGVQALVDQSLLASRANANGEPRFAMLETTREYALECLAQRGATVPAREAHAAFFHAFARVAEPGLKGSDGWTWFRRVDADLPNIRLALEWFRELGDIGAALEIAACLEWFWTAPGFLTEGRAVLESLLPLAGPDVSDRVRASAWMALGDLCDLLGDYAGASAALINALASAREAEDQALVAAILRSLGSVMIDTGRLDDARKLLLEAYELAWDSGDEWNSAAAANMMGVVARWQGELMVARDWHETALSIWQHMGAHDHVPTALVALGWVWLDSHEDQRALETMHAALSFTTDDDDDYETASLLDGITAVASRHGQYITAAHLLGAAAALRRASGRQPRPHVQEEIERVVADVRGALGNAAFAVAWAEGQMLNAVDAKRLALGVSVAESSSADGLSTREREVLALLVEGASDNEIADRLFITRRTASKHVASILEKLDAGNRTAAATIAHRRGLV